MFSGIKTSFMISDYLTLTFGGLGGLGGFFRFRAGAARDE